MSVYFYATAKDMKNIFDEEEMRIRPMTGTNGTGVYFFTEGPEGKPAPLIKAAYFAEGSDAPLKKMTEYIQFKKSSLPGIKRKKKGVFMQSETLKLEGMEYTRGQADEMVC